MLGRGILKGLSVTIRHFIETYTHDPHPLGKRYFPDGKYPREKEPRLGGLFTVQYPEEKLEMFPRFRGPLVHLRDPETGEPKCTGCGVCVRACPVGCIEVMTEGKGKARKVLGYRYDMGRCIFCRLCVEACRFDAIELSQEYELAQYDRENFILEWDELLKLGEKSGIKKAGEAWT